MSQEGERHQELMEMLGEIRDALQLIAESLQKVTAPLGGLAELVAAGNNLEGLSLLCTVRQVFGKAHDPR